MMETGEIRKIILSWTSTGHNCGHQEDGTESLGMETVNVPFIMLAIVIVVSVILLIFEIIAKFVTKYLKSESKSGLKLALAGSKESLDRDSLDLKSNYGFKTENSFSSNCYNSKSGSDSDQSVASKHSK